MELVMPEGIKTLSKKVLKSLTPDLNSITELVLPDSLEVIEESVFENAHSLKKIKWPKSPVTIEECAFHNSGLEELSGAIFNSIEDEAFRGTPLREVSITLENLYETCTVKGAFKDCYELEKCVIKGEAPEVFYKGTFRNCKSLREVSLEGTVTAVLLDTFLYCENLQQLKLSEETKLFAGGLESGEVLLGERRLSSSEFLSKVQFEKSTIQLLHSLNSEEIDVECCVRLFLKKLPSVKELLDGEVVEKFPRYDCVIGDIADCYDSKTGTLILRESVPLYFDNSKYETSVKNSIVRKVKRLIVTKDCKSFEQCDSDDVTIWGNSLLEEIVFEDDCSVKALGNNLFSGCRQLKRVVLPKDLKVISELCFAKCENLREVVWPNCPVQIGWSAFTDTGLEKLKGATFSHIATDAFAKSKLTEVDISIDNSKGVLKASIDPTAFGHCKNLEKVRINCLSSTKVRGKTFIDCPNLREIRFEGQLVSLNSQQANVTKFKLKKGCKLYLPGNIKECDAEDLSMIFDEFILDDEFLFPIAALKTIDYDGKLINLNTARTLKEAMEELYPEQFAVYYGEHDRIIEELEETSLF